MKNRDRWVPTKAVITNGVMTPKLSSIFGGSYHTIKLQLQVYHTTLSMFAKGDLADLGCGAVPYLECYSNNVRRVVCADRFQNDFTDAEIDLNSAFPFDAGAFDTVLFSDVINHVSDTDNLFSESLRVLRPGGHLIVFTPFLYWISEAPNDYYRFTRFGLEAKCSQHGFEIVDLYSYGKRRDVMLDLFFKRFRSRIAFRFFKVISDAFFKSCSVNRGFEPFPLGYVLVGRKK